MLALLHVFLDLHTRQQGATSEGNIIMHAEEGGGEGSNAARVLLMCLEIMVLRMPPNCQHVHSFSFRSLPSPIQMRMPVQHGHM
jgi:hypothetical protein